MSTALWMNIPLMAIAFGLMVGIPLWMVLRRPDWHGKRQARAVPAYFARNAAPIRATVRVPRSADYDYDRDRALESVGARTDG